MITTVKSAEKIGAGPVQATQTATLRRGIAVGLAMLVAAATGSAQPVYASEWGCMLAKKLGRQNLIQQYCFNVVSERSCMLAKRTGKQAMIKQYCDGVPALATTPSDPSKSQNHAARGLDHVNLE